MHEMGLTQEIVQAITERVDGAPVTRVVLEVGGLSGVVPDSLRFCFELCVEGTPLEGAEIEVVETPGIGQCRDCSAAVQLETFFGTCECGSTDLDWQSGDEVKVVQIEVKSQA